MPKHGPSDGSRVQLIAFLPIRFSPSLRPTVVVVLPSPAGVGVIAVTRIRRPSGRSATSLTKSRLILAMCLPYGSTARSGTSSLAAISPIGSRVAARAMSMSLLPMGEAPLGYRLRSSGSGTKTRAFPEAGLPGERAGVHLLAALGAHPLDRDRAAPCGDLEAVAGQREHGARFPGAFARADVVDLQLVAVEEGPGAGLRVGAADQIVHLGNRLVPVDLGVRLAAPALVGGLALVLRDARRLARAHQVDRLHHGVDPHGEQVIEVEAAERVVRPDLDLLLQEDRPLVQSLVGPEDGEPGLGLA